MENLEETLKFSAEPTGIVVHGSDGRMYFLTDEQARDAELSNTGLYEAFRAASRAATGQAAAGQAGPEPEKRVINCGFVKAWLDRTNPDSALWRSTCLTYFDNCV